MLFVIDHEVIGVALEEDPNLIEAETVLDAVRTILLGVPLYLRLWSLRHWLTKSMTDSSWLTWSRTRRSRGHSLSMLQRIARALNKRLDFRFVEAGARRRVRAA